MKLTFLTTLILLVSFACTSYDAFMTEYDNVSKETAQIIDKEPNKGGLDKADEYLKAQTVMLKKKLAKRHRARCSKSKRRNIRRFSTRLRPDFPIWVINTLRSAKRSEDSEHE
ncbi:MAG: hypothetical protein IPP63_13305 [Chloracidobacterium sp.]|nr:hypothetical protein [Chloracidobacterium sp.]